jgi:PAS domain S-box-containing protein
VVRNRPRSFYEEYRPWIWAAGAFILTEAALIVLLLAAHARRRRAEEALSRQNERLGVLNRVAQVTLGATEPEEMCDALVETLRGVLPADRICVHSIADRAAGPVATACFDTTGRRVTRVMERSRDELCSREVEEAVIRERRPLRISLDGSPAGAGGAGSGVRIPMIVGDRVVGILSVLAREENAYDADDVQLLSSIAREVGPALEAVLLASQLRESREVLRATLNSTADGILVVDSAGDVLVANPRFGRLWNLPEHLLRKGIADRDLVETVLGQVADPAGFQARIAHLYQSSVESLDEIRLKDGRVLERFSCPLIRDGSEIGRVWNFRDITQRKEAEEATLHGARVTEAVAEASLSYLETGSVRTMTQTIVDRALEITGARVGMILERDRQGQPRILSVSSSVWEALTDERLREELRRSLEDGGRYPLPVADSLLQVPLEEGRAILTNRAFEQPRWHGVVPGHLPIDSFLGVPMKVGTEVLGVLALANREGGFDDRQLEEAEAFAVTAVLALRAARTEEERAVIESQLRQSQKLEAIGQLAGGVAHDFNNILQAILGYAELARMRLPKGHPVGPSLDEVRKATDRAISLVRQLLVFGRREPLKPDDIDLNGLVDDLLKMLRRVIGEQVDLEVDRGEDLWTIRADPGRMEQLVINLCVNARDAMPDGGRIRIETRNELLTPAFVAENPWAREGRYVRLVVSDTGSGIPEEVLDHIFEPFFTTKDVGQGTGLGLATVYGIVEQHHGMIDVRSEPGEGATFRVYLPAGSREVVAPGPGDRETVVEGGRETILLAEDDPGVRTLMTHILEEEGYTVLVTENGEDAVREFAERSHEIDLALLDVVMPKMSGRQVLEVIRDIAPGIPVLFSSGYSPDHVAGEIAGDGRTALVSKPCGRHELLRTIRELLEGTSTARR